MNNRILKLIICFSFLSNCFPRIPVNAASAGSFSLRPLAAYRQNGNSTANLMSDLSENIKKRDEASNRKRTWLAENTKYLTNYTIVSCQMEAGLDRGLIESLVKKHGKQNAAFAAQITMTGGLGALMHDLVCGWKKNGADIIAPHIIWNDNIKGIPINLPKDIKLGDMIRGALRKTDMRFEIVLEDD